MAPIHLVSHRMGFASICGTLEHSPNLGGYQISTYELSGLGTPAQINAARLTASMFPVLSVSPLMGRAFTQEEDDGSQQVALLSYQTWRSRFDGDIHILGRKILLDRKPYEIIGVMPREFEFPLVPGQLNRCELWVPMSFTEAERLQGSAGDWAYNMVGLLKPGITPAQAQQDADGAAQEIMRNFPPALRSRHIHPAVQPLDESTVAQARPLVRTLLLAVTVVLFIACANLAGLLLVRVIKGTLVPSGHLPFELPSSALAVEQQRSDVPDDSAQPLFPRGFGMRFSVANACSNTLSVAADQPVAKRNTPMRAPLSASGFRAAK
jgi:hypothetical protein